MKNLLMILFAILLSSCSKEKINFVQNDIQDLDLRSNYPNWVQNDDEVYLYLSDIFATAILNSESELVANQKINSLANESKLEEEDFRSQIMLDFTIKQDILDDFTYILQLSDKFENENYIASLNSLHNQLMSKGIIGNNVKQKVALRGCSLGAALWSVAAGVGTLISCGGAIATCVPTGGVTCVGCAIAVAGTAKAMKCWFN